MRVEDQLEVLNSGGLVKNQCVLITLCEAGYITLLGVTEHNPVGSRERLFNRFTPKAKALLISVE